MKLKYVLLFVLMCSAYMQTHAQTQTSTLEDAKNLVAFQQFYKLNQDKVGSLTNTTEANAINLSGDTAQTKLAELIVAQLNSTGTAGATTATNPNGSGAIVFGGAINPSGTTTTGTTTNNPFSTGQLEKVKAELAWYIKFAQANDKMFDGTKQIANEYKDFPKSFEYLDNTIGVLHESTVTGYFTSGAFGLGALLGVSEADILQGIADWALNRAQQELMQSFLREWLEKIENDPILAEAFPNTLNMLSTSDLASIFTDGDTWKATFQQDLDGISNRIPEIATLTIDRANIKISEQAEREIVSGLQVSVDVFDEIGKNKKVDDILILLGQEAYLRHNPNDTLAMSYINRSVIGMDVFLSNIRSIKEGVSSYPTPNAVLSLSEEEILAFWKLVYLRDPGKLNVIFNVQTGGEQAFYDEVAAKAKQLQLQIAKIAEGINGISEMIKSIKNTTAKEFSVEEFQTYVALVFDILELGVDNLTVFGVKTIDIDKVEAFKELSMVGLEYVSAIQQGIKTKDYGKVALNIVNMSLWIKDYIAKNQNSKITYNAVYSVMRTEQLMSTIPPNMTAAMVDDYVKSLKKKLKKYLRDYPDIYTIVDTKITAFESDLTANGTILTPDNIKNIFKQNFTFTETQQRTIVEELASVGLANLDTTNEALNKYGKLMASIILAKDSNDIKDILDEVAMATGGYMVKQRSVFSTTVTFYPGIEYGWENVDQGNGSDAKGTYIGATLPIGVEFAFGTNWQKFPLGAVGVFVQVLDLGAVLNYSLTNKNDDVETTPEYGFKQVLSPGAYATFHVTNTPITLGAGASYSPELRNVTGTTTTVQSSALQFGFFVAVDLNVFTLYGSRKKYPLKSRSLKRTYNE